MTRDEEAALDRLYGSPPGFAGWLAAVNHRQVGLRYIITAFIFFLIGGVEALILRVQLAQSELDIISPDVYNQLFTMHGTTMMFLFAVPMGIGIANYLVPLMIGARDMPFPRMNAFGYWCFLFGGIFVNVSFLFGMAPDGGWFAYVPLTGPVHSPGLNMDFWLLGITFIEFSAILGAIEIIVSCLKTRAPGMTMSRMPLFVWSMLVTALMIVFAFPALLAGSIMLEVDRKFGTHFFNPEAGGSALLWQHLFWIFGHPEVYIIFLPAAGVVSMIIATFTRRRLAGYTLVVMATVATGFLSFGVWVHHMFTVGLPALAFSFFVGASVMFAIPNGVQMFAWIGTIWTGRSVFRTPYLFIIGFIVLFLMGGLTGVMVAVAPFDWQAHDTYFVVAHFHYVLIGGFVFPIFGALAYWFPKVTGRMLGERLGVWSFALVFTGFNLTFLPQHILGLVGMPRRVFTYRSEHDWDLMNLMSSIGAFVIAFGVLAFLVNVVTSLRRGEVAGPNPWSAGTLEWATSSPPRNYNFARFPIVRGRAPLWKDRTADLVESLPIYEGSVGNDVTLARRHTLATSPVTGTPQEMVRLPSSTQLPLFAALGLVVVFAGILVDVVAATLIGLAFTVAAVTIWAWPRPAAFGVDRIEDIDLPQPHPAVEQGRSVDWWAMAAFLLVVSAAVASMLFSYFLLRTIVDDWPPDGIANPPLGLPLLATGALLLSAVAVGAGQTAIRRGNAGALTGAVTLAFALAGGFLALQLLDLSRHEFTARTNAFGSIFVGLVGLQLTQVLGGMYGMALVALRAWKRHFGRERHVAVQCLALYWYFTVGVWLVVASALYIFPRIA